jgi:Zn-dependent protease/predicted transcriptional regulator
MASASEATRREPREGFSWSWQIARVAGIPIYIHWTFWILLLAIVLSNVVGGRPTTEIVEDVGFVAALFACVVLHELGHALAAARYGVKTKDITLLPIGGVARLLRMPEKPIEELVVAIAGPAVNVVIAGLLYLMGARLPFNVRDPHVLEQGGFLDRLLLVNLFLVLFNLIPAFPMDGGRILRSLLAMTMNYGSATRIAATIGQLIAIAFVFIGLMINPFLILIGLFVWIGAQSEAADVTQRIELKDVPVRDAMLTEYQTLSTGDTLGRAVELLLAGTQQDFPVFDGERMVGVLTRPGLLKGLAEAGREGSIIPYVQSDVGRVEAGASLGAALSALRGQGLSCAQVVENGRPLGLLTADNIAEYLMVKTALGQQAS